MCDRNRGMMARSEPYHINFGVLYKKLLLGIIAEPSLTSLSLFLSTPHPAPTTSACGSSHATKLILSNYL